MVEMLVKYHSKIILFTSIVQGLGRLLLTNIISLGTMLRNANSYIVYDLVVLKPQILVYIIIIALVSKIHIC